MSSPVPASGLASRKTGASGWTARGAPAVADEELIPLAAAGDRAAWIALVERYIGGITGHAWYMLGDQSEAEDVAQETFVRFLGKISSWELGGAAVLRTWLYRVTINLCIDRHRKRLPEPVAELPEVPDEASARAEEGLDRRRFVREALSALPERQRTAIALIYYQGFTNREAAELMDVSIEAVESLLARARRALKTALSPLRDDLLRT